MGGPIVYVEIKKPFVRLSQNTEMDSYTSRVNRHQIAFAAASYTEVNVNH